MTNGPEFITRLKFETHHMHYLESCARLRGISVQGLVRRIMLIVAQDQLVLSIADGDDLKKIDDGSDVRDRAPSDKLFDAVTKPKSKPRSTVRDIEDVTDAPTISADKTDTEVTKKHASTIRCRQGGSVPMVRDYRTLTSRKVPQKTKSELRAELAEAVANTAAMPVE